MRLLNTASITLTEFTGADVPPYAILSHTWEKGEVLFADIENGTASTKKGFSKVQGCCQVAREQGYEYVWIDACCIDKSSSAELSEAINSMFRWYKFSAVCYVFLQDVAGGVKKRPEEVVKAEGQEPLQTHRAKALRSQTRKRHKRRVHSVRDFPQSRWFTRGWTLQELLAPRNVEFYTREWYVMGTRSNLVEPLEKETRIPKEVLKGGDLFACSVAERMSWAAGRRTTREEDQAYSLMGLFNVNMPLIYGEGSSAFRRLQLEIFTMDEDYSIFAWTAGDTWGNCLASSPSDFFCHFAGQQSVRMARERPALNLITEDAKFVKLVQPGANQQSDPQRIVHAGYLSGRLRRLRYDEAAKVSQLTQPQPPAITSRGLRVSVLLKQTDLHDGHLAFINLEMNQQLLCIKLKESESKYGLVYERSKAHHLYLVHRSFFEAEFSMKEIYLRWLSPQALEPAPVINPSQEVDMSGLKDSGILHMKVYGTGTYRLSLRATLSGYPLIYQDLKLRPGETKPIKFTVNRGLRSVIMLTCCDGESKKTSNMLFVAYGVGGGDKRPWCHVTLDASGGVSPRNPRRRLEEFRRDNVGELGKMPEGLCERSAVRCKQWPDVVFTAVVRHPAGQEAEAELVVKVEPVTAMMPWTSLLLKLDKNGRRLQGL